MLTLVGCGGSSVDLPEEVMTDDAYAVVWTDFKAIKPDEGVKMLSGLADDMPDEQPKSRLWLSAEADDIDGKYRERWEAFTDAGCQGMLTVFYRVETTEGEGEFKRTSVKYRKHTFIKAKKSTKASELEKALDEYAEEDGNDDLELKGVGKETGWFWITRDDAPDSDPDMPEDGKEENAKAFGKLLAKGDGAPIIAAWRMIKPIAEEIDEELKREGLSDERKDELKLSKATESIVLTCTPGKSAKSVATITFEKSDHAKTYAEENNDKQLSQRAEVKRAMMNAENPPHPSVIDGLTDSMVAKASGKNVKLTVDKGSVEDMLNIIASMRGAAGDGTSPRTLLDVDSLLHVPKMDQVPGVRSVYDQLNFGRIRLPQ